MTERRYVLMTAARNEDAYIGKTLESVVTQTVLPKRWIIVSDGSRDHTDEIVGDYAARYPFITLIRRDGDKERNFGSKVRALSAAYSELKREECDYVGVLDADVSFDRNYFESLFECFDTNPQLGIGGGVLYELQKGRYEKVATSEDWSVSGPIQTFLRKCYDDIGEYRPVRRGIDAVAEVMARQKGYQVRAFPALKVIHHRKTGSQGMTLWKTSFALGAQDYRLGYDFFFFAARCCRFFGEFPMAPFVMMAGYCWSLLRWQDWAVPEDFVRYLRREQRSRLWRAIFSRRSDSGLRKGAATL